MRFAGTSAGTFLRSSKFVELVLSVRQLVTSSGPLGSDFWRDVRNVVASDLGLREADGTRCGVWIARGQTNLGAGPSGASCAVACLAESERQLVPLGRLAMAIY